MQLSEEERDRFKREWEERNAGKPDDHNKYGC